MRTLVFMLALSIVALSIAACAGPQPPAYVGDSMGRPSYGALPSTNPELAPLTEEMRHGLTLCRTALSLRPPSTPARCSVAELGSYTNGPLRSWLAERRAAIESARQELDLAAEQAHHQRIMAGALLGLLNEDVAKFLGALPVPDELAAEPDIAAMYSDVLAHNASPFVEQARQAYRACAANAVHPEHMHHWSVFCARRADGLPESRLPEREGTVVTFSIDYR